MKKCTACDMDKQQVEFSKNQSWCKDCCRAYRKRSKLKAKPEYKELICTKCRKKRAVDCFNRSSCSSSGYHSWCKKCTRAYVAIRYGSGYHRQRRRVRVEWLHSLKVDKPCLDCGKQFEPICMDFDHIGSDKVKGVSRMVLENVPKKAILKEIEKCELVCVLCHNRRTQKRLDEKYPVKKRDKYSARGIQIINKAKQCPCCICQETHDACNMQFDHIDPNNKFKDICQLKKFKVETLMAEIAKCQVICALCHRRKSIMEQQDKLYPASRSKPERLFVDETVKRKACSYCREIKGFDEFPPNKKTKLGIDSWCRECVSEYKRQKRRAG